MQTDKIKGVTFDYQLQPAAQMATVFRAAFGSRDGVIYGCDVSLHPNGFPVLAAGDVLICGRHIQITSAISIPTSAFYQEGDNYCRIMLEVDVGIPAQSDEFTQASIEYEYVSSLSELASLRQDDVNHGGTIYDMEICVVRLNSSGNTDSIVRSWGSAVQPPQQRTKIYQNVSVPVSAFVADNTHPEFPYKADIAITGVTANNPGNIIFAESDAQSGIFASQAAIGSGYVRIYSRIRPSAAITISAIVIEPEADVIQYGGGS